MRQLYITGHIESVHPHRDADGMAFTQLLLPEGPDGDAVVAALAKVAVIWDTHDPATDWDRDVPKRYKRKDGKAPGHDWAGHRVTQTRVMDLQTERALGEVT